mmetsp:Transcript_55930/g.105200  ORF Transcript_55930/g.105200 Transcript_55930/m.105200 type:complete len:265 (+) Transcript_55930:312-1106(+)
MQPARPAVANRPTAVRRPPLTASLLANAGSPSHVPRITSTAVTAATKPAPQHVRSLARRRRTSCAASSRAMLQRQRQSCSLNQKWLASRRSASSPSSRTSPRVLMPKRSTPKLEPWIVKMRLRTGHANGVSRHRNRESATRPNSRGTERSRNGRRHSASWPSARTCGAASLISEPSSHRNLAVTATLSASAHSGPHSSMGSLPGAGAPDAAAAHCIWANSSADASEGSPGNTWRGNETKKRPRGAPRKPSGCAGRVSSRHSAIL